MSYSRKFASPPSRTPEDIVTLQARLLNTIHSAFDPTAPTKSDDDFLNTDYSIPARRTSEKEENPFIDRKAFQNIAEKAKDYVKKRESEPRPLPVASSSAKKKDKDTFLTGIGLETTYKTPVVMPVEAPAEEEDEFGDLDIKEILADSKKGEYDDLAELRRMIKSTKREMEDYGRELMDLRDTIGEINDYASKELGYSANNDLLRSMDCSLQSLKMESGMKFMKKSSSNSKGLKAPMSVQQDKSLSLKTPVGPKSATKPLSSSVLPSKGYRSPIDTFKGSSLRTFKK